jgi:tripartite-type tricarboxylate transporter receptor subunit TctC
MLNRRAWLASLAGAAWLSRGFAAGSAGDAAEPDTKPWRLVVAYPFGGLSDGIARAMAPHLTRRLGAQVLVDNRAGAGGALALEALARSPASARMLVFCAITPLLLDARLAAKGIVPVASVMLTPFLLVGTSAFKGQRFDDLLALARERPGSLRWASSGIGTTGHLVLEQLQLDAGISVTHVPYTGGGQQITDALGGQFELLSSNVAPQQLALVQAGRLRALAVGAPARLAVLPQVPTLSELGYPRANRWSTFGIFASPALPADPVQRLNAAIRQALAEPDVSEALRAGDNEPGAGSPQDFARSIAGEAEAMRQLLDKRSRPRH